MVDLNNLGVIQKIKREMNIFKMRLYAFREQRRIRISEKNKIKIEKLEKSIKSDEEKIKLLSLKLKHKLIKRKKKKIEKRLRV